MKNKTKKCTGCGEIYPATKEYFYIETRNIHGLCCYCKKCSRKRGKEYCCKYQKKINKKNRTYYRKHRKKINKKHKLYRQKNKEKTRCASRKYYQDHKVEHKEMSAIYYKKNKKKIREKEREYARSHQEERRRYRVRYVDEHREKINEYSRNRRRTDIEYRILQSLRKRLCGAIKSQGAVKSDHTIELVGCSIKKLLKHIESQFDDKMTWKNYGKGGWHIDHIKPCIMFDLTKPEEQKKCFNYKNLQPMWWLDNFKKSSIYKGRLYRKGDRLCQL